jgi:hypothetical protein
MYWYTDISVRECKNLHVILSILTYWRRKNPPVSTAQKVLPRAGRGMSLWQSLSWRFRSSKHQTYSPGGNHLISKFLLTGTVQQDLFGSQVHLAGQSLSTEYSYSIKLKATNSAAGLTLSWFGGFSLHRYLPRFFPPPLLKKIIIKKRKLTV